MAECNLRFTLDSATGEGLRRCVDAMARMADLQRDAAVEIMSRFSDFFTRIGEEYALIAGDLPILERDAQTNRLEPGVYGVSLQPTARFCALVEAIARAANGLVEYNNGWPIIVSPAVGVAEAGERDTRVAFPGGGLA